ncbi:histidine phosphatase family protein [Marininema halotolerans]|uniref:Alpha-ribazole phosphatase/probable phosphoglycerate mutase n=1 Tax=Marininema halotolerans TaxID=1155944 RepID=A0A1I6RHQ4_9BACL|nr:histidine phosphatase family protein [Marininema halotolerans]SFS64271.1 alpha-ribazole phosphatase/probable phosphoglycerate mutase [Marininema halotolerans]
MKRKGVCLLWIRHGQTEANRLGKYCGLLDEPLNEEGHRQVRDLTRVMKNHAVDHVYSSDRLRCRQTVAGLKGCWSKAEVSILPDLRELSFGEWEGLTYNEIHQKSPAPLQLWLDNPVTVSPPGGETLAALDQRLTVWLTSLVANHTGQTVAVVSHGGPIRWFLSYCLAKNPDCFWERGLTHGGWFKVTGDGMEWQEDEQKLKGERGCEAL